jgi:hypothetical protein
MQNRQRILHEHGLASAMAATAMPTPKVSEEPKLMGTWWHISGQTWWPRLLVYCYILLYHYYICMFFFSSVTFA